MINKPVRLLAVITFFILNTANSQEKPQIGRFKDPRDGQEYHLVKIGDQVWMKENLRYKTNNGSWSYDNDEKNVAIYGRLYNWEAAKSGCPIGFHLPTDDEWKKLEIHLGMKGSQADADRYRGTVEGGKLKAAGTIEGKDGLWAMPNTYGTNESGFSALPGGNLEADSTFLLKDHYGFWWTATENSPADAWYRIITFLHSEIVRYPASKMMGFSVRCIKD